MRRNRSPLQQIQELASAFFVQKCAPEGRAKFLKLAREQWTGLLTLNAGQFILFVAELLCSHSQSSLALRAHAYHCAVEWIHTATKVLTAGLLNQPQTATHSYGLRRCPILFEFAGAGVVIMMSLSVGLEALLHLYFSPSPSEDSFFKTRKRSQPLAIDRAKFFWTLLPFVMFPLANWLFVWIAKRVSQRSARYSTLPSASNPETSASLLGCGAYGFEMKGSLLLIVGAGLSLCGALLAFTGWALVDSLGALLVVALVAPAAHSLLARSAPILLLKAPPGPRAAFDKACREASTLEGVVQCSNEHFWMYAPGLHVGSLTVSVRAATDRPELLRSIHARFASSVSELTVQVEDAEEALYVGGDGRQKKHRIEAQPDPLASTDAAAPRRRGSGAEESTDSAFVEIVPLPDSHTHAA